MFPHHDKNKSGYTLVETLITVLLFAMVAGLVFFTMSFFNQISHLDNDLSEYDQRYEKVHAFLQRQIDGTDHVYIDQWGRVYLWDMESPEYYDNYRLEGNTVKRHKYYYTKNKQTDGAVKIEKIYSNVSNYPFEASISSFELFVETDEQGYTGNLVFKMIFEEYQEEEYESIITVPEGKQVFEEVRILE